MTKPRIALLLSILWLLSKILIILVCLACAIYASSMSMLADGEVKLFTGLSALGWTAMAVFNISDVAIWVKLLLEAKKTKSRADS
jgi:hypothetical protein